MESSGRTHFFILCVGVYLCTYIPERGGKRKPAHFFSGLFLCRRWNAGQLMQSICILRHMSVNSFGAGLRHTVMMYNSLM